MADKKIDWIGSSFKDLTDSKIFSDAARRVAGYQLRAVQRGLDPDDWKPFDDVGPGTQEIRINLEDGWYRIMYVAKFSEAVYVLHSFKKKTNQTSQRDVDIAKKRYKEVINRRGK